MSHEVNGNAYGLCLGHVLAKDIRDDKETAPFDIIVNNKLT